MMAMDRIALILLFSQWSDLHIHTYLFVPQKPHEYSMFSMLIEHITSLDLTYISMLIFHVEEISKSHLLRFKSPLQSQPQCHPADPPR